MKASSVQVPQYLITDYGENLLFNKVYLILANRDMIDNDIDVMKSVRDMSFVTTHLLDEENAESHRCNTLEVQTEKLGIEDQIYWIWCGGMLGRKVKFKTDVVDTSILVVETWAETSLPPPAG